MTVERLQLAFKIAIVGIALIAVSGVLHTVQRLSADPPDLGALLVEATAIMSGWNFFDWLVMIGSALIFIAAMIVFADVILEESGRDTDAE